VELKGRVARALLAQKERARELERLEAELDPSTGRRTRMAAAVMMGVVWTVLPEVIHHLAIDRREVPSTWLYAGTLGLIALGGLIVVWGRESLMRTLVNRRAVATVMLGLAAQLTLQVGGHVLGLTLPQLMALHLFTWLVAVSTFSVLVDRRLWPSVVVFLVAFVVAATRPSLTLHLMALSDLALLVNFVVAWVQPAEDRGYVNDRMKEKTRRR
jgi:hypothetical protein